MSTYFRRLATSGSLVLVSTLCLGIGVFACSGDDKAAGNNGGGTGGSATLLGPGETLGGGGSGTAGGSTAAGGASGDPQGGGSGGTPYVPTNGCAAPTALKYEPTKAMIMDFQTACGAAQTCFTAPDGFSAHTTAATTVPPAGCTGDATGGATAAPAGGVLHWTGQVTGPTGVWIDFDTCVDVAQYNAIQVDLTDNLATPAPFVATLKIPTNTAPAEGGTCATPDCANPSLKSRAPHGRNTVTLPFEAFTGANPAVSLSPLHQITGVRLEMDWPCTGGTPYDVDLAVNSVKFVLAPKQP